MGTYGAVIIVAVVALLIILLVTVNVTTCDTFTGPFGLLRFTACESEPIINPA